MRTSIGLLAIIISAILQPSYTQSANSVTLLSNTINWSRTVTSTQDQTTFTITIKMANIPSVIDAWASIGLNNAARMNGAHAFVCRRSSTQASVQHYYNSNYGSALFNPANPTQGIISSSLTQQGSNVVCKFTVDNLVAYNSQVNYDRAYLIHAFGQGKWVLFFSLN